MSRKIVLLSMAICLLSGSVGPIAKAHAQAVTLTKTQIDRDFIRMVEGSSLKGYVPLPKTTQSGVTIAHGFDLGQLSLQEFNALSISDNLKNKLRPYVGLRKQVAVAFLKKHPLAITPVELQQLNTVAANKILQPLVKYYEKDSKKPFLNLPAAAQTALFSYAYQHGAAFMKVKNTHSQELWRYYVTQNWSKASKHLRQSKLYILRRNSEADLLDQLALA